jgi:hypothetical protein
VYNEFLCKPVSAKALFDRLISILPKPCASVQLGEYYVSSPRSPVAAARAVNYGSEPPDAA